ncbi:transcription factor jumonji (jmjC)domain-containing protein [Striga asiatica]|uniref:Transcription factor jumonji (JmjC)domain-containing protein n=1 Tax=Striga asiatica TaxID=4170 RepID=A0A5A7QPV0_STRAF|nr:transcription factor jumonji (jmjC)domain-containing protein [Striga asiatica]
MALLLSWNIAREEVQGMETDDASFTEVSRAADWPVNTEMLGEVGLRLCVFIVFIRLLMILLLLIRGGFLELEVVAVEMAVASEIGMRQRPLPCRYCMAEPMSSSISFATCCSVMVVPSFLLLDDDVINYYSPRNAPQFEQVTKEKLRKEFHLRTPEELYYTFILLSHFRASKFACAFVLVTKLLSRAFSFSPA